MSCREKRKKNLTKLEQLKLANAAPRQRERSSDYRAPRYRSVIRAPRTRVHRAIECVDVRLEARAIERDGIE